MHLKWIALSSLVALASSSFGSFELVMQLDYGSKSIKRFDGETGAFLGEFGRGRMIRPNFMTKGPNPGEVVVTDVLDSTNGFSAIQVYNYNTGEFVRQLFDASQYRLAGICRDSVTGNYVVADQLTATTYRLYMYDPTLSSVLLNSTTITAPVNIGSATLCVSATNGVIRVGGMSGFHVFNNISSTPSYASISGASPTNFGNFSSTGGPYQAIFTNTNGVYTTAPALAVTLPGVTAAWGSGQGHVMDYVSVSTSTGAQINAYNRGFFAGSFGAGQITNGGSIVVIAAPEPGTMVALALGGAVLVRRRRRSL